MAIIAGCGTAVHLATELFKQKAQVDIVHVPYRGTVAVLPDLISGRVVMMIDGVPAETKNIQSGVVRALAVTTATRSPSIPDVPTMREVGLDYEVPFWTGLYAPIRTPQAIVDKLTAAAHQAMHDPAVTKRLGDIGTEGSARLRPSLMPPPASSSSSIGRSCATIRRCSAGSDGAHAVFCTLRPSSAMVSSRMMNFWILPVTVIGNASTNLT